MPFGFGAICERCSLFASKRGSVLRKQQGERAGEGEGGGKPTEGELRHMATAGSSHPGAWSRVLAAPAPPALGGSPHPAAERLSGNRVCKNCPSLDREAACTRQQRQKLALEKKADVRWGCWTRWPTVGLKLLGERSSRNLVLVIKRAVGFACFWGVPCVMATS